MQGFVVLLAATVGGCGGAGLFRPRPEIPPVPASDGRRAERSEVVHFGLAGDDDYVVRVVAAGVNCSGTLIDEDRVLTAHHCVSQRSAPGEFAARDQEPEAIRVELGGDYFPWGEVGVRAIVAPPCGYAAGEGDIAVLVLERRLVGVPTLAPELDRAPRVGDQVDPAGFGRCVLSADGVKRQNRRGGRIQTVRGSRYRLEASICPGDSGGPALDHAGNLVGVISASVMDTSEATVGLSEFTRLDRWRPVFSNAQLIADGESPAALPPPSGCPKG
jgi:hypothetical protein